jgi:hypothetical protein
MKSRRFVSLYAVLILAAVLVIVAASFNSTPQVALAASPMFQHPFEFDSGGEAAQGIAVADVNGDGVPDVIVATQTGSSNGDGTVGVLIGIGDGHFQPTVSYDSGGTHAWALAVADLNGDGKLDIAVMNAASGLSVGILLGNGDGTFAPVVDINGLAGYTISVADVNGDGKPDLITSSDVLLGNGDGTFQSPKGFSGGSYATVGDVNGDGKMDIVALTGTGNVNVLLGNGDGTFQTPIVYSSGGTQPTSVALGDLDGDGKLDIAVANYCSDSTCTGDGSVGVLLGNGNGTFNPATVYDSGGFFAQAVAIGDVDGNGRPDVIVGNYCAPKPKKPGCSQHGVVGVLLNQGNGLLGGPETFLTPEPAGTIAIADVNGGRTDLMLASLSWSVMALYGEIVSTTTAVSSTANPSTVNESVTLTATIQPAVGVDQGGEGVGFYDGSTLIGTGTTYHGVATLTTSFPSKGKHQIKAVFSKNLAFNKSTGKMTQVVNP